ncbi:hypothetical protein IW140_002579 [Coemansia sp. RSA 1813]|nr:hypothetical protein EV178_002092 [Coemansia sp. RSA 1646]KAJ2090672.1 hypothetical protein IW138_002486 [Coemansia sp. RSA 986]KAJ2216123.1 hypothetical protein EV179_001583 [Coemansia sp. RSA 487]KAJ2570109.1 hypothetical protein IW140_002579 [Coemansia sp. RSA 1813]
MGDPAVCSTAETSGLESRDCWFQSLISQSSQHPSSVSGIGSNKDDKSSQPTGLPKLTNCRAMSSDSESDDISKSLSFLLAQQLGQQQQQQPQNLHGGGVHSAKQSNMGLFAGSSYYNAALTDILEIGYDNNGSRRVISMPNPLGNLSFEIPINPPVHPEHSAMIGMSQPCEQVSAAIRCPIDDVDKFFVLQNSPADTVAGVQQASSALGITEPANKYTAAKKRKTKRQHSACSGSAGPSCRSSPGICCTDRNAMEFPPPLPFMPPSFASQQSVRQAPAHALDGNNQKDANNMNGADALNTSPPTKRPIIDFASNNSSRIGTPLLLDSAATMPGTPSTPSASSMSSLLSHRVDRQMAASGARPLLFVRPRSKEGPARRRKRRCVSANNAPESEPAAGLHEPDTPTGIGGSDVAANGEQHTLQWQRISEQRRRDAMRENFDLLKRMLPQAYMDSDDGRELARPVLLARFLRWVDDTLIEMEALKTEVAQLRSQVHLLNTEAKPTSNDIWKSSQQQSTSSVMPYYSVSF